MAKPLPVTKSVNKQTAWQGAWKAYGDAWELMRQNPKPLLTFLGIYLLLSIIGAILQDGKNFYDEGYVNFADVTYLIFLLAMPIYGLSLVDGKKLSVGECFKFNLARYFSLLVASLLFVLIIFGSILLFIVPAIWTIAWFYLVSYPVIDKKAGPIQALKESKRLTQNNKAKVWGVIGVSVVLAIPAILLTFIPYLGSVGSAFLSVLSVVVGAMLYRWLQHNAVA